jgi:hypothetical protein
LNEVYNVLAHMPSFKDTSWEDIKVERLNSFTNLSYKVSAHNKV